jgi:hypothetical protein
MGCVATTTGFLPQHPVNFSPRLGLAWTPVPSLILRSGFGIFYDRFPLSTINRLFELDGMRGFTQVVEDASATALHRSGSILAQPLATVAPSIARCMAVPASICSDCASSTRPKLDLRHPPT